MACSFPDLSIKKCLVGRKSQNQILVFRMRVLRLRCGVFSKRRLIKELNP